jgi:hypothetical protein
MLRATVPKTPVNENGESAFGKNEVRLAEQLKAPPPSGYIGFAKNTNQAKFGIFVSRGPDFGHYLGPLSLIKNVHGISVSNGQI